MVCKSMIGSGVPGPFPTTPGQVALCSFGKVLLIYFPPISGASGFTSGPK